MSAEIIGEPVALGPYEGIPKIVVEYKGIDADGKLDATVEFYGVTPDNMDAFGSILEQIAEQL